MAFDLSEVLKSSVSDSNTEQIVRIQLDLIDPDPYNFYSLDGIDALAANIELIGLQQPLRVRPGEAGRFIIVSGHRRRAACMLIRDGGSEQFAAGVPCIVEYGEASDAMRKLRLIYANAATRDPTAAELSRQAEEVEALLYELKEQGVVFPGRMRDHVAAAVQKSTSKLARLHAIRANLIPELLTHWDADEIKEETAYQLSRYPAEIQRAVAERMEQPNVKNWPYAGTLESFRARLDEYMTPRPCPTKAGATCSNCEQRVMHNLFNYDWAWCGRKCCLDCAKEGRSCGFMCKAGKDRLKLDKEVAKEKEAAQKKDAAAREEIEQKALRREAKRLLDLAERAGLSDSVAIGEYGKAKVGELREIVAGKAMASKWTLQPYNVDDARRWAQKLKCSIGELLGEKPQAATPDPASLAPTWQTGRPKRAGRYFVRVKHKNMSTMEQRMYFDPHLDDLNCWRLFGGPLGPKAEILGWWPIPEEEE